jgi:multiple sugar transport system permease protein
MEVQWRGSRRDCRMMSSGAEQSVIPSTSASAPASTRGATRRVRLSNGTFGLLTTLPALLILAAGVGIPVVIALISSVQAGRLDQPDEIGNFVGVANFASAFSDSDFLASVWRMTWYLALSVVGQFVVGFALAIVLNSGIRGQRFLRGIFLLPWILPSAAVTLLWLYAFNPQTGVVNQLLEPLGLVDQNQVWLQDFDLAMPTIILFNIWRGFPFTLLVMLAGLQTVPREQIEAAMVDGASAVQQFIHVTLPTLRPLIALTLIVTMIWQAQSIIAIAVMTQGGPGQETTIATYYLYQEAFQRFDFGTASAMAVLTMVGLVLATMTLLLAMRGEIRKMFRGKADPA